MVKLIFNADDYGIDFEANKGIIYCAKKGLITSASVSVVNDACLQGVEKLKKERISLGLHINLTEGNCLTNGNRFTGPLDFISKNPTVEKVTLEICKQIEKFKDILGYYPQHLDSHQYITYLSSQAFEAMLSSAKDFKIPIRNPYLFTSPQFLKTFLEQVFKVHKVHIPISSYDLSYVNSAILYKYEVEYRSALILTHPQQHQIKNIKNSNMSYEVVVHPRINAGGESNSEIKLLESVACSRIIKR